MVWVCVVYDKFKINVELVLFFIDLLVWFVFNYLIVLCFGVGMVVEFVVIGWFLILVFLFGLIDQDQFVNVGVLVKVDGVICILQIEFMFDWLVFEIFVFVVEFVCFVIMVVVVKGVGWFDVVEWLVDLVVKVVGF